MSRRKVVLASVIGTIVVAGGVSSVLLYKNSADTTPYQAVQKPSFSAALPADTPSEDIDWNQLNPPDNKPVFTYIDTIQNVTIKVTQQPLPQAFQHDTDRQVAKLATDYNATNKLDVNGTTVYIGNNVSGPQSVIFTKKDLLISIMSEAKISNDGWSNYIQSLH